MGLRRLGGSGISWGEAAAWLAATALVCAGCMLWLDGPVAAWAMRVHPIPDLANAAARGGDAGRELMMLEQWGQWVCSVIVITAVVLLDQRRGVQHALMIAAGCVATVIVSYLLKDLIGRSRPWVAADLKLPIGSWVWGGPGLGFTRGSSWQSFPSSHTTGAFALSLGLSGCYPRGRWLFMALAAITAVQRVLHGAHFISDVVAGFGLTVVMVGLVWRGAGKRAAG